MARGDFLKELYDENDKLKPEELCRITPGTSEFAILDATIRRERRKQDGYTVYERLNAHYRSAPDWRFDEEQDHTLPAFDSRSLNSIRSLLEQSESSRRFILEDDASIEQLLLYYRDFRNKALKDPAPLPSQPHFPFVSNFDWEDENYSFFARMYAARGIGMRPEDVGITRRGAPPHDEGLAFRTPATARSFTDQEAAAILAHWQTLNVKPTISPDRRAITYDLNPAQSVTISSAAIQFTGSPSDETMRLGMLHVRDHWGGKLDIGSKDERFILRSLAFADLMGVKVTSHTLAPEQRAALEREIQYITRNYPDGFFSEFGGKAPAPVRTKAGMGHDAAPRPGRSPG